MEDSGILSKCSVAWVDIFFLGCVAALGRAEADDTTAEILILILSSLQNFRGRTVR